MRSARTVIVVLAWIDLALLVPFVIFINMMAPGLTRVEDGAHDSLCIEHAGQDTGVGERRACVVSTLLDLHKASDQKALG